MNISKNNIGSKNHSNSIKPSFGNIRLYWYFITRLLIYNIPFSIVVILMSILIAVIFMDISIEDILMWNFYNIFFTDISLGFGFSILLFFRFKSYLKPLFYNKGLKFPRLILVAYIFHLSIFLVFVVILIIVRGL